MTWHLQPSSYVLAWTIAGCLYVLFQLWWPEIAAHREAVSVVLLVIVLLVAGALYGL